MGQVYMHDHANSQWHTNTVFIMNFRHIQGLYSINNSNAGDRH